MSTKQVCRYGTARNKVLDTLEKMGMCSVKEVHFHLRKKVSVLSIKGWLTRCAKEGVVLMPHKGFYCLASDRDRFSEMYVMGVCRPPQLEALIALMKKGRPCLPDELSAELETRNAKTSGTKASTYVRCLRELRAKGLVYRPRGEGCKLLVSDPCRDALVAEGYVKRGRVPEWLRDATREPQVDPELEDLLS